MAKPRDPRRPAARFTDTLEVALPGEHVAIGIPIDRASPDYVAGAAAREAGKPRDGKRSLNWVLGWDEAAPPRPAPEGR